MHGWGKLPGRVFLTAIRLLLEGAGHCLLLAGVVLGGLGLGLGDRSLEKGGQLLILIRRITCRTLLIRRRARLEITGRAKASTQVSQCHAHGVFLLSKYDVARLVAHDFLQVFMPERDRRTCLPPVVVLGRGTCA